MKKIFILLGVILIGITLSACNGSGNITIPSYTGVSIDSSAPEAGGQLVTFYKPKNDVAKVEVAINNPSDVPITSILINGHKYFSAGFDETSTNQLVSFDLSVGTTLGEKTYRIDEIVYDDGSISKSVIVTSSNSFKIYTFKNAPTVTRNALPSLNDSLQVEFTIEDTDDVILNNSLKAELYLGEEKIDEVFIDTGIVLVEFDGLSSDNNYYIKVRASYDLDDSNGLNIDEILFSGVFLTVANAAPIATVNNSYVSSDSVVFNVTYTDPSNVTTEDSIYVAIFKNDVLKEMVPIQGSIAGITFTDLLSNQNYKVKVLSDFNLDDGAGETEDNILYTYSFTTTASIVPTPQLINLIIEENRVSFDIYIDDEEEIIDKDTLIAKLYIDGELKQIAPIDEYNVDFQLYNLLSGFDFTVVIEASYDLNDGTPVRTDQVIYQQGFTTKEKTIPSINVVDVVAKQGYVTLELSVIDPYSTIQNTLVATLYENGIAIQTKYFDNTVTDLVFEHLIQYQQIYSVEVVGNYNLQDGTGLKADIVMFRTVLVTENQKAPAVELNNLIINADSIEVDVRVMDSDETIIDNMIQISIYRDGVAIETIDITVGTTSIIFENLLSSTDYSVVVTSDYEVNDGSGIVLGVHLINQPFTSNEKSWPQVNMYDLDVDTDSVTIYYDVTDTDNVIVPGTLIAILTLNNVPVGEPFVMDELGDTYIITGLTSGLRYKIEIFSDLDFKDDDETIVLNYSLDSSPTPIPAVKVDPEVTLENITSDNNSVTFDAFVIDDDNAVTGNLKAVLYKDGEITLFETILVPGNNIGATITGVEFGVDYELKVVADYTYNDGTPPFINAELALELVSTVPLVVISNIVENDESIVYTAIIEDTFNISDSSALQVALYDQGDNLVGIVRTISSGTTMNIFNLWSDYDYYIVITGSYSGGTGEVGRYYFHTQAKEIQPLEITNLEIGDYSITFDINDVELPDSTGVIINTVYVYLYEYDDLNEQYVWISREVVSNGGNSFTMYISGLENTQYVIQIEATINLNDSYGDYLNYVIHSQSFIHSIKNLTE